MRAPPLAVWQGIFPSPPRRHQGCRTASMNISATSPLVSVLLLLVSMSSIQASASLAKTIFPLVGPAGTTALRLLVASAILLVVMRPWNCLLYTSDAADD